ncbi:thioredoxin-like protein, partial [Paraphysoderma sedebokerense]
LATAVASRSFHLSGSVYSKNVVEATEENFEKILKETKVPVIVDFYANWCGPCKMLAPIIQKVIEAENGKVKLVKIDVDEANEVAAKYQVAALPTVSAFKEGKEVDKFVGLRDEKFLKGFVAKLTQ